MICFGALLIATLGGQYIIQMIYGSLDIINEYLGVGFIILLFFAIILILALIKVIILTPVIRKYVKKCIWWLLYDKRISILYEQREDGLYTYRVFDNTNDAIIVYYNGAMINHETEVIIPEKIDGYNVVILDEAAI